MPTANLSKPQDPQNEPYVQSRSQVYNHGQKGLRIFYSDEQIRTTTTFAHQTQPHPLPPESMLVNAHTTMIWCSNNIGLGGEGGLKWKLSTYFDTGCYKV